MQSTKGKVLFVHKDEELHHYASKHLEKEGFRIIGVKDGEEATMLLLTEEITVIVADARSRKLNSLDLLEFVDAHHDHLPFIVLAEDSDMDMAAKAVKKGAFDYLKMPFDGYELVSTVRKAIDFSIESKKEADKLSEERKRREVEESQGEVRTLLTSIIPSILLPAPQGVKTRFIKDMCDNVENLYCNKYISRTEEIDPERVAEIVQLVFNQLGADFRIAKSSPNRIVIEGTVCPWGDEARNNPVLCMLTKAIVSRIAVRCRSCAMVMLEKTIGNGDEKCVILIENL